MLDEAVLHRCHLVVSILDGVGQLNHPHTPLSGNPNLSFKFRQSLGSLARAPHFPGLQEHGIPQFD